MCVSRAAITKWCIDVQGGPGPRGQGGVGLPVGLGQISLPVEVERLPTSVQKGLGQGLGEEKPSMSTGDWGDGCLEVFVEAGERECVERALVLGRSLWTSLAEGEPEDVLS